MYEAERLFMAFEQISSVSIPASTVSMYVTFAKYYFKELFFINIKIYYIAVHIITCITTHLLTHMKQY